jgi:hypothetical protein
MRAGSAEETLRKVVTAYEGSRQTISQFGAVPKDANGYDIKFSEKGQAALNVDANDKVMPVLKSVMLKHGLTDKNAGFVSEFVDGLIDAGMIPKPADPNETWKTMAPDTFKGSDQERIEEGKRAQMEGLTYVNRLAEAKALDKDMLQEAQMLTATPAGLRLLKFMQASTVQRSVNTGGEGGGGDVTQANLDTRRQDPRNRYGDAKYDPAFAAETQRLYKLAKG